MTRDEILHAIFAAILFAVIASVLLQSFMLGALLVVSLIIHELGHVAMVQRYGLKWKIRFGFYGAATETLREERRQLDHYQNSLIHLAGPYANLLQAMIFLALYAVTRHSPTDLRALIWLRASNLAALLVLLNLLPLGRLSDGGKFLDRLFASLTERLEIRFMLSLGVWFVSLLWLVALIWEDRTKTAVTLGIGIWYVLGMYMQSREDEPSEARTPRAMTAREGAALFGATAIALLLTTGLVVLQPFWLSPSDAAGIAQAIEEFIAAMVVLLRG